MGQAVTSQVSPTIKPTQSTVSAVAQFAARMEMVIKAKAEEKSEASVRTVGHLLQQAEVQLGKVKEAIKKGELKDLQKHLVHLANYSFLLAVHSENQPKGKE